MHRPTATDSRPFFPPDFPALPRRRHAVVVGGSIAGMLAARVLSEHFDGVTVLERDRFPDDVGPRSGLPQGPHAHVLLERGRGIMERLLPGLTEELVSVGATLLDFTRDVAWMSPAGWYVRFPGTLRLLACSRDLIDWGIRSHVAALANVRVRQGVVVTGLLFAPGGGGRVSGVRLRSRTDDDDAGETRLAADLVVVADGRHSHLAHWLAAMGYEPPEETVIDSLQGYASRYYRPPAGVELDWQGLYIQQAPPDDPRGGTVLPVEGGRWLVSLLGGDGDYPPTNEGGFLAFARSLRSPALHDAIVDAEPLGPIVGHRATENRWRHFAAMERSPDDLVVVGDAVCAFNPVYGHGMSVAALGAETLDRWLRDETHVGPRSVRDFQRHLDRAIDLPWHLAAAADYRFRNTDGPPPSRAARLTGHYFTHVVQAATTRPWLRHRLSEVMNLLRSPASLFGPRVLANVAWDALSGRAGAESCSPSVVVDEAFDA